MKYLPYERLIALLACQVLSGALEALNTLLPEMRLPALHRLTLSAHVTNGLILGDLPVFGKTKVHFDTADISDRGPPLKLNATDISLESADAMASVSSTGQFAGQPFMLKGTFGVPKTPDGVVSVPIDLVAQATASGGKAAGAVNGNVAMQGKLALDNEAIARLPDGTMFISDEYGPNIYRFSADGHLMSATQPPAALVPMRHGKPNFASDNPGPGAAEPNPKDPETGRQNNQGLEGMSMTPDGKFLIAVLQSATRQDGGDSGSTRQNTRALVYDASDLAHLKLAHEYVVPLPVFKDAKGNIKLNQMINTTAAGAVGGGSEYSQQQRIRC